MPEAWPTVRAFLAVQTQWRVSPNGVRLGLDYPGARAAAKGLGIQWKKVFGNLRLMATEVLNAQSETA